MFKPFRTYISPVHYWCTCSPNRGRFGWASELKLLVVTASTTLNRVTPSHRFRTHNSVVVGSSPTRLTLDLLGLRPGTAILKPWERNQMQIGKMQPRATG
jgi:hypothetical protein